VGTSLDVSRAYLFENHETADGRVITSQRHEWTAPGTVPQLEDPRLQSADFRAHGLDRWMTLLGQGNPVCGSVDDLPPAEAAVLEAQDVRTVALVPIHTGTRWWGILGLDECRRKRAWLPAEVDALRVLAQMIGSCVDRQRIEAALRQSQKMEAVGQLAGGVAHDFNNNLTATLIQLGMLRELTADLPEALDLIQELEAGANRAAHLTRQLLLFSRKSVLQIIPLDLHELLADLLGLLRRLLGETIRLELRETPGLPPVEADASLLGQVVLNLCVNARDAMPRNGTLTLATRVVEFTPEQSRIRADAYPGTFVCLSVSDTGTGIAPGVLPHIFEPFFTTKEVGKGTGLGLATVHGIVTQHRGWVEVDSAVDQGSTFRVFLPVAPRPPSGPLPAAPPCSPRGTETLLLVEDEPDVRAAVARCLRRWGYEVLEAGTAREALALWSSHSRSIALLFTDLVLPGGMSGHELARHLLREQPGLRVVLSSGYSPDSLPDSAPEVPPFARFPKPYDLDALAAEIRRLLDRPPPGPGPAGG
jgi:two-component system cell cycle sensor histidine kinase/response regulator CckA